jgi:hypothetical protein
MNKAEFERVLEDCRSRLMKGESIEKILETHPAQAGELEPLLLAAQAALSMPKPEADQAAFQLGKNRLLGEADRLRKEGHFTKNGTKSGILRYSERWSQFIGNLFVPKENIEMKLAPRLALYVLITILVGGFFTVSASASSLPGDALYDLKLGLEQTRLALAFDPEYREELEIEFEQERLSEVGNLLEDGRKEDVEFRGSIQEKNGASWVVGGITVQVAAGTELKGELEVGTLVKVEAQTQGDGSLLALEIYPVGFEDLDEYESEDDDMDDESYDDDMDDDSDDDMDDDSDDEMDDDSDDEIDDDYNEEMDDSNDDMDDDSSDDEDGEDSSDTDDDDEDGEEEEKEEDEKDEEDDKDEDDDDDDDDEDDD